MHGRLFISVEAFWMTKAFCFSMTSALHVLSKAPSKASSPRSDDDSASMASTSLIESSMAVFSGALRARPAEANGVTLFLTESLAANTITVKTRTATTAASTTLLEPDHVFEAAFSRIIRGVFSETSESRCVGMARSFFRLRHSYLLENNTHR